MQNDPFIILGISKNATQEEIKMAYEKLKKKYADLRFEPGEVGANAARMYTKIENAYADAMEEYQNINVEVNDTAEEKSYQETNQEQDFFGTNFESVKLALKNGDITKAQEILDDIMDRNAEWHFYQAAIFHRKNWFDESRKQLQISVQLEPNNPKYKKALDKLIQEQNQSNPFNQNPNQNGTFNGSPYNRTYDQNAPAGVGCCDCCAGALCADCCCECMGGDLIGCC